MTRHSPTDPDDAFDPRDALITEYGRDLEPLLASARNAEAPFDAEAAWSQLAPRLRPPHQRWTHPRRLASLAVGFAAVVTVAVFGVSRRPPRDGGVVRRTAAGVLDSARLPDGTVVVLDGQSRVATDPLFGRDARVVHLVGRAHFRVAHDASRPFRVVAHGMVAEALGTAFTVSEDPLSGRVDVLVTSGRVAFDHLKRSPQGVVLHAGERATHAAYAAHDITVSRGVDPTAAVRWTAGVRRLDGVTLAEALPQLSRWYGMTVVSLDSALLRRRLQADWQHATARDALAELTLLLDASVVQRGDTLLLRPRREAGHVR